MNLADPELEYIDPTPNVHSLFIHFDSVFFWATLVGKAVVRWSKRMYSCAGMCSYEGRGGLCDIALSEPLLKLRPRKDLVETLLHEMIHAYLFIVGKDQSRDGHGPNFQAHMHRINRAAGVNITIYHDFHDEVKLYQTHIWRCNGPCQKMRPYFGIVRRSTNRAPGRSDFWWDTHRRACGGFFVKYNNPEIPAKTKQPSKKATSKGAGDITKYINNNNGTIKNKNAGINNPNPIIRPTNLVSKGKVGGETKTNTSPKPIIRPAVFVGSGQVCGQTKSITVSVVDTVKNVWANKTTNVPGKTVVDTVRNVWVNKVLSPTSTIAKANKRLSNEPDLQAPPKKTMKIDDYFKTTASTILKDVYGKEFTITQSDETSKFKAKPAKETMVLCPICDAKVSNARINTHIDGCLNKVEIKNLTKETIETVESKKAKSLNEINNRKDTAAYTLPSTFFKTPTNEKTKKHLEKVEKFISSSRIHIEKYISSSIEDKTELPNYIDLTAPVRIEPSTSTSCIDLTIPVNADPGPTKATCPYCSKKIDKPLAEHIKKCLAFINTILPTGSSAITPNTDPGTSKTAENTCPCCDKTIYKPLREHFDECTLFFYNDTTSSYDGSSFGDRTIVIDENDDEFDETQTLNATGTKTPCPCCMKMVEIAEMNDHLDVCLSCD